MIRIACPRCRVVINAPEAAAGKVVRCPKCRHAIRLPPPVRAPQVSAAQPPPAPTTPAPDERHDYPDPPRRSAWPAVAGCLALVALAGVVGVLVWMWNSSAGWGWPTGQSPDSSGPLTPDQQAAWAKLARRHRDDQDTVYWLGCLLPDQKWQVCNQSYKFSSRWHLGRWDDGPVQSGWSEDSAAEHAAAVARWDAAAAADPSLKFFADLMHADSQMDSAVKHAAADPAVKALAEVDMFGGDEPRLRRWLWDDNGVIKEGQDPPSTDLRDSLAAYLFNLQTRAAELAKPR